MSWINWFSGLIRRGVCAGLLGLPTSLPADDQLGNEPEVWLNHYQLGELADSTPDQWETLASRLDGTIFYINTFWTRVQPHRYHLAPDKAAATAEILKSKGIPIAIEGAYFDWRCVLADPADQLSEVIARYPHKVLHQGVGRQTALNEINLLQPLWKSGFDPDFMILDDAMRRLTIPGQDLMGTGGKGFENYETAAEEVAEYMTTMREKFPRIRFISILNFPNWGWKGEPAYHRNPGRPDEMNWGDAHAATETMFRVLKEQGHTIYAIHADHPWRYYQQQPIDPIAATVDWRKRLHDLEAFSREKGTRFHLTVNSETGYESARAFCDDSLKYLDAYLAAGGNPDTVVAQSWYPHPERFLPEQEAHTMSWLGARFLDRLEEIRNGETPVAEAPVIPRPFDRSEARALCDLLGQLDPDNAPQIVGPVQDEWLHLPDDPDTAKAAEFLKRLRLEVALRTRDLQHITAVIQKDGRCQTVGRPEVGLPVNNPCFLITELVNASAESKRLTLWAMNPPDPVCRPEWIPPGSSRLIAVKLPLARGAGPTMLLRVGTPDEPDDAAGLIIQLGEPLQPKAP